MEPMATLNQTVGEIAAASLGAVRVFEKYGIDYCCGGKVGLNEICEKKGLPVAQVAQELESAMAGASVDRDWATAPLRDLVNHIVSTHHEYLRQEMPLLDARLAKVVAVHGDKEPELLPALLSIYRGLREELELHLHKEEAVLFPVIAGYEQASQAGTGVAAPPFGTVRNPIRMMEHEHDSAGQALESMRKLTSDYTLPPHACTTYRVVFEALKAMEADLHIHIHLENNILFPRAAALEAALSA